MRTCASCGEDAPDLVARCPRCGWPREQEPEGPRAVLGRFHPLVAERLLSVLAHRGIAHHHVVREHDVEVRVDTAQRDTLRAELASTWTQIVGTLPEDTAVEVLASGGAAPGWFDAPAGGWVDRAGRLVVEPSDDDPTAVRAPRTTGPALAGVGGLVLLLAWYGGAGDAMLLLGGAMAVVGLLLPR